MLSGESLDVNTVVREFVTSEAAAEAAAGLGVELDKTLIERDNTMMEIDLDALVATLENDDKATGMPLEANRRSAVMSVMRISKQSTASPN